MEARAAHESRHTSESELLCIGASPTGAKGLRVGPWEPGKPVLTTHDRAAWLEWRKARKRDQQTARRARLRRIDYHASPDTAAALDLLWKPRAGYDYSSIIDGIVRDWLAHCHRNTERPNTGNDDEHHASESLGATMRLRMCSI